LQRRLGKFDVTGDDLTDDLCDEYQIRNYKGGKVDHWFRRTLTEATGNVRLLDMRISEDRNRLSYVLPDDLAYPVVID
jgi:hypothetical protein